MENNPIPDIRYAVLFSLVLVSSIACPGVAVNAAHALRRRWKLFTARIRAVTAGKPKRSGKSFWEIDMTRFEP